MLNHDALERNCSHMQRAIPRSLRIGPCLSCSPLAALADLEVQFEIVRDSLEEWSGSEDEKRRCCAELERARRKGL